ncbi:hypothetical protein V8G54_009295, partial [Vigna mungo]
PHADTNSQSNRSLNSHTSSPLLPFGWPLFSPSWTHTCSFSLNHTHYTSFSQPGPHPNHSMLSETLITIPLSSSTLTITKTNIQSTETKNREPKKQNRDNQSHTLNSLCSAQRIITHTTTYTYTNYTADSKRKKPQFVLRYSPFTDL